MISLRQLKEGDKGVIAKVRGRGEFRKRLSEMGFISGKWVTVIRKAPLQDPVEYLVMDSNVSLRLSEAGLIEVIPQAEAVHYLNGNGYNGFLAGGKLRHRLKRESKTIEVALVGNPNSGKTTLFNHASRSHEHVGNYAGVTVDAKEAVFRMKGYTIRITDLPGTYSLTEYSPEELYVRQHLIYSAPDIVINVVDASNIERNLFLTTQLIDLEQRVVIALNMFDELKLKGDDFDFSALGRMLGIPFVPTISSRGKGIRELFEKVIEVYEEREPDVRQVNINYGAELEHSIGQLIAAFSGEESLPSHVPLRYLALKLLEKDQVSLKSLKSNSTYPSIAETAEREIRRLELLNSEESETLIANAKYGFIEGALRETFRPAERKAVTFTQRIDSVMTGRIMGYPVFMLFMWLMFEATFILGKYPVKGIEWLVAATGSLFSSFIPDGMLQDMIVDGIVGGVGGVIVFLPNILILFFFISVMEDTGYMARVAFIVDKLMHKVGLHGKSFIPLLMGFGCNVPAIMATRTIENRNDRLVTMLITPLMSCSARYPVYVLLISAFFTSYQGSILFSLYVLGIVLAGMMALVFKKTLFRAREIPFVMELPPYRMPTTRAILRHTWFKGAQYLKKMGTVILLASIIIWALGYFPRPKSVINKYENRVHEVNELYSAMILSPVLAAPARADSISRVWKTEISAINAAMTRELQAQSVIGHLGRLIEPMIHPLGFDWRLGVSLVAGSAAKEVVVSTMGVLFQAEDSEEHPLALAEKLKAETIDSGPKVGQPVFTPLIAFSFMVFVLIYFPCIAVIAAIRKESGQWKWSAFLALYTTVLAWIVSFTVYQGGTLLGF